MSGSAGRLTLETALEKALESGEVVLGVDFDGTLSHIVDHPRDARPVSGARAALQRLARSERIQVVILSGRARQDLIDRLGVVDGVIYVGEHGSDDGTNAIGADNLESARDFVRRLAETMVGSVVEEKTTSVTFHTRRLDAESSARATAEIRDWAARQPHIELLEGKEVFELSVATTNKGEAIRSIAGEATVIYFGDDTTDETVFELLRPPDVAVKVGQGETAARYRVDGPDDVVKALRHLSEVSS